MLIRLGVGVGVVHFYSTFSSVKIYQHTLMTSTIKAARPKEDGIPTSEVASVWNPSGWCCPFIQRIFFPFSPSLIFRTSNCCFNDGRIMTNNGSAETGGTPCDIELQRRWGVRWKQQRRETKRAQREKWTPTLDKGRIFVTSSLVSSSRPRPFQVTLTLTDSATIVHIARQLCTHSKNVSLLCFLYTKGGLCFSLGKYSP